ncbi:hypothetical protein P167DRAFT_545525 [Morchella conica CCBAS932]|uniref:Uncharacterized protein n=1 Tax=Morchella conica CCBAS932 TaxID=1392247 RepID=A0A3N4KNW4_9PEZI|nr:hypothetical protein P167DRAFT_545525 [Morchella conica CCBAS932]
MSDSDSTITQSPRRLRWNPVAISHVILELTNTVTALEANYPEAVHDHDSQALRWYDDITCWDYKVGQLAKKVKKAAKCYRTLSDRGRLSRGDPELRTDLADAWAMLVILFTNRANLYNMVCRRAVERPTDEDLRVLSTLEFVPKPQEFKIQDYEVILAAIRLI